MVLIEHLVCYDFGMDVGIRQFVKKRLEHNVFTGLPLTIFVIIFVFLLATFLGITHSIVDSAPMVKIDANFAQYLYKHRTVSSAELFYVITSFANLTTVIMLLVVSSLYLYFKKELAYLYALAITVVGTEASVFLTKIFINRARPGADIAYYLENSKSFPSAHSAIAMAFYGFIAYYLVRHAVGKNKRSLIIILGVLMISLIGFSRLYLGVHYLSDVLGGFIMAGLWLLAGITFREKHFYTDAIKKGKDDSLKLPV